MSLPPIVYRRDKTSPLTAAEADGNIENLATRLAGLEGGSLVSTTITGFAVENDGKELYLDLSNGSRVGPIVLPASPYRNVGAWQGPTAPGVGSIRYEPGDLVEIEGSSYLCLVEHDSQASFADDLALGRWQLIAQAGRNAWNYRGEFVLNQVYGPADLVIYRGAAWVRTGDEAQAIVYPGETPGWYMLAVSDIDWYYVRQYTYDAELGQWVAGARLEDLFLDLAQRVTDLEIANAALAVRVTDLENANTAQQAQIDDLIARVTALESAP